jgi:hypothetical protein
MSFSPRNLGNFNRTADIEVLHGLYMLTLTLIAFSRTIGKKVKAYRGIDFSGKGY